MTQDSMDIDVSKWFSSYGVLTSGRIFERLGLKFKQDMLIKIVNNTRSVYYQMLQIPLKNVFNGIIMQQAQDYQVYVQKLFIDYLLSGEVNKDQSSPGGITREDLAKERENLHTIIEQFNHQESLHQQIIMTSQRELIEFSAHLQQKLKEMTKKISQTLRKSGIAKEDELILKAIQTTLIEYNQSDEEILALSSSFWTIMSAVIEVEFDNGIRQDLATALAEFKDPKKDIDMITARFLEQVNDIRIQFCGFRKQFYDLTLRVTDFVKSLPEYHPDENKELENRSSLYFDTQLGNENT